MQNNGEYLGQSNLANKFHQLHHTGKTLVLPNAWDCVSARLFQESGFEAIATTSSGISWACGYKDGEHIPPGLMIDAVRRIVSVVTVPVTADIEGGYFRGNKEGFRNFIEAVIDTGVVGVNLEDGNSRTRKLNDLKDQVAEIEAIKAIARNKGINLFVNARTDAMDTPDHMDARISLCIERAKAFEDAGADGIFIPFIREMKTVEVLKRAIKLPLNILIDPALNVAELKALKVERITLGGKPILATLHLLKRLSRQLRESDEWKSLFTDDPTYGDVNEWFV